MKFQNEPDFRVTADELFQISEDRMDFGLNVRHGDHWKRDPNHNIKADDYKMNFRKQMNAVEQLTAIFKTILDSI